MLVSQFIKTITHHAVFTSQTDHLARVLAVYRGELKPGDTLESLAEPQRSYLRAMAAACLVPSDQHKREIVDRLAKVNAVALFGASIDEIHSEDASGLYAESELNLETVLDALSGLPVRPVSQVRQ